MFLVSMFLSLKLFEVVYGCLILFEVKEPRNGTVVRKIRRDVARNICTIARGNIISLRRKMLRLYRRGAMNCVCTIDMD